MEKDLEKENKKLKEDDSLGIARSVEVSSGQKAIRRDDRSDSKEIAGNTQWI